jgi:hypothetical protein
VHGGVWAIPSIAGRRVGVPIFLRSLIRKGAIFLLARRPKESIDQVGTGFYHFADDPFNTFRATLDYSANWIFRLKVLVINYILLVSSVGRRSLRTGRS